jgi:sugar (pentulose or hexulose) kinase
LTNPNEIEALRARVRQLHASCWQWFDTPTTPAAPILLETLTVFMDLVTAVIEAGEEIEQLRAELAERPASQRRLDD